MNFLLRRFVFSLFIAISAVGLLPAQPTAPTAEENARLRAIVDAERPMAADGDTLTGFEVDPANREESRTFYRTVFAASEGIDLFEHWIDPDNGGQIMDPTHAYTNGDPGDTSQVYRNAVQRRINYVRAMAGIPPVITFNSTFNAKAQQAALMMSANDSLDHFPPQSWAFWTADGAEAAANSNLAWRSAGPDSVMGYMEDHGDGNEAVGHRRWFLYPQTEVMGTGDVPGHPDFSNRSHANAIWVQDGNGNNPRPELRETFVAWPPAGYVPFQMVHPRWSISLDEPKSAFSSATVTMTRKVGNGAPESVGTIKEPLLPEGNSFIGESTLVWVYDGLNPWVKQSHDRPSEDVTYHVTVGNVMIDGQPVIFEYDVIVFDPEVSGAGFVPATITGTETPAVGSQNSYDVDLADFATGLQWRSLSLTPNTEVEGAETGTDHLELSIQAYNPIVSDIKNSGQNAFRFTVLDAADGSSESMVIPVDLLIESGAELKFHSRLGTAGAIQQARAEVTIDGGKSWKTVWSQNGTGFGGETSFTERKVSLNEFLGKTVRIRFSYVLDGAGSYWPGEASGTGWYVDDIEVTNSMEALIGPASGIQDEANPAEASFVFSPSTTGEVALQVRPVYYEDYPLKWGPAKIVTVQAGSGEPLIGGTPVDGLPGWFLSDWFGYYNTDLAPWLFHGEHGFIYRFPGSTNDSMFAYDDTIGVWWWTSQGNYPYFYIFNPPADNGGTDIGSEWIFYFEGSKTPRVFGIVTGPSVGSFLFFNP